MTAIPQNVPVTENSNAIALGLLGDEWNLTIVKLAIMSGVSRYKDFRDTLGIANSVLTVRLRRLTEAGVFAMRQYSDAPRRYEYVLTERGRDLWQVLLTIWSWEAIWVTEHIEPQALWYIGGSGSMCSVTQVASHDQMVSSTCHRSRPHSVSTYSYRRGASEYCRMVNTPAPVRRRSRTVSTELAMPSVSRKSLYRLTLDMMASLTMARFHSSPSRPRAMALEFAVTGTFSGIALIFRLRLGPGTSPARDGLARRPAAMRATGDPLG